MSYKKVKLSEICTIEKGATGITKAIAGEYPMVTMAETRTSHNEYQFDTKAVLIPLVSSSGHGHASMKRIHYQEGKFAVGSILCALVPKNEEIVNARFLYNYLHFQRESILVPLMRGAANVSLSIKSISSVEINLPPIEVQISINKLVDDFKSRQDIFQTELKTQANLLTKLRQAYLQEAVMGKLTDPSQNNAQTLLKAIKSKKAELTKQGKLRKEKPLAPIKPEEIPFEIPDNWVWCRLGEIIEYTENLDIQKYLSQDTIINYVDIDSIDNQNYVIREVKQKKVSELSTRARRILKPNYIAYSTVRPYLRNIAIIDQELENFIGSTGFNVFKTFLVELKFAFYFLLSPFVNNLFKELMVGFNSPSITNEQFERLLFPLPPLTEQKAIVSKVEGLLGNISLLESENKAQQIEVQRLMGAVLQEAFGGR